MQELLEIALRVSVMYVYALALLRLAGKRSVASLTPLDFVVATIIGDMFDDVFWAEIPLSQGSVGLATIIFLHTLLAYGEAKSSLIYKLISSTPSLVIKNARLARDGMERERTPEEEIYSQLRINREEDLRQVNEGRWEVSGDLSVLRKEPAREMQKQDLPQLKGRLQ